MLASTGYLRWHTRLGLDTRTVEFIDRIRAAPPSRRVSSGRGAHFNVSARFPSLKMQFILQAESRTLELAFLRQADHDLGIVEIWDQPPALELRYASRRNRPLVVAHTPTSSFSGRIMWGGSNANLSTSWIRWPKHSRIDIARMTPGRGPVRRVSRTRGNLALRTPLSQKSIWNQR